MNGIHVYDKVEELILDNNGLQELCLPPMGTLKSLTANNNELKDLQRTVHNLKLWVSGRIFSNDMPVPTDNRIIDIMLSFQGGAYLY